MNINLPDPEWVTVDPDIAREMLTHNTHNRNSKPKYHEYAADMLNGYWRPEIGDPLRFAGDGTLLDGQNRLLAVIEADMAIPFLVVRGLSTDSQSVMDSGASRKFADVLKLNGEDHNTLLAAVVRLGWESEKGISYIHKGKASNSELLRFLDDHPELRDFATQTQRTVADHSNLAASIIGALWWRFSQIDIEDAEYFFQRLGEEEDHTAGEPIFELRRTLKRSSDDARSKRAQRNRAWLMAVTIKAWNAYREHGNVAGTVGLYRFAPGGKHPERFPVPE